MKSSIWPSSIAAAASFSPHASLPEPPLQESSASCGRNQSPASGALGSPGMEPIESIDAQLRSNRGQYEPSGRRSVQPSLSPGVFSQKYASMREGRSVVAVGVRPRPAPLMLHQFAHDCRRTWSTPLRPVSMMNLGAHLGRMRVTRALRSCTKLSSLFAELN